MLHCQSSFASGTSSFEYNRWCRMLFFSVLRESVGKYYTEKCSIGVETCLPWIYQVKWFRSPLLLLHCISWPILRETGLGSMSQLPRHLGILDICELSEPNHWLDILLAVLLYPYQELDLRLTYHNIPVEIPPPPTMPPHEMDHACVILVLFICCIIIIIVNMRNASIQQSNLIIQGSESFARYCSRLGWLL